MNTPAPMTPADITAELVKFIHPTAVVELRALNVGGPRRTVAGWFDGRHLHDLARTALALTRQATGVYFTPNPVNPALLARCPNRAEEVRGGRTSRVQLTTDADVIERRYLIVDIDPVRTSEPDEPDEPAESAGPAELPTTDAELATAMIAAVEVIEELRGHGWAWPMWMRSGNGVHLVFPLAGAIPAKMPAGQSDPLRDALALLRGSNFRGRDLAVRIGEATHAAAAMLPVPGTWAKCGEQSAGGGERRHRTAAVLETPGDWPTPGEAVVVAGAVATVAGTDAMSDDTSDDTDREAGTRYANGDGGKTARVRRAEVVSGDRVGDKPAKSRAKSAKVAQNGTPAIFE